MDSSLSTGFMAAFVVSGSVAFLALQLHRRLLSDFMKKIEFELGGRERDGHHPPKKTVRFATDVVEPSSNSREYRRRRRPSKAALAAAGGGRAEMKSSEGTMPLNRQVLYKGIIQYRSLKGHSFSKC